MAKLQTILVPTDFSEHAAAAVAFAVELAKGMKAAIHLLHVNDFAAYVVAEGTPLYDDRVLTRLREDARTGLAKLQAEVRRAGVESVEFTVLEGQSYMEIIRQAEQLPADLIVMGTHGRRGFSRLMVGSVAERVVRSASCPVLTVPLKHAPG